MNSYPKNLRLTASLVTCLSLGGCASDQFETAAPPSDNPGASTSGDLCVATDAAMTVSVGATFSEGEWVRDFYSGEKTRVENGEVTMTPAPEAEGLLLLEAADAPQQSFNWAGATVYFTVTDRFANGRTDN
ncbi:MAG: alpha-amylase, partial [Marinobacter sp.]|nr:alpha-amylase [Marinobacter sp.]